MKYKIRFARIQNKFSQEQVSNFLNCDQSLYSKYEREEREIPLRLIVELAKLYNVSVDYLVGLTDELVPYPRASGNEAERKQRGRM